MISKNSKTQGTFIPDSEDSQKSPTQVPDIGNKELFPSLGSDIIIVEKPVDETEKPKFLQRSLQIKKNLQKFRLRKKH